MYAYMNNIKTYAIYKSENKYKMVTKENNKNNKGDVTQVDPPKFLGKGQIFTAPLTVDNSQQWQLLLAHNLLILPVWQVEKD